MYDLTIDKLLAIVILKDAKWIISDRDGWTIGLYPRKANGAMCSMDDRRAVRFSATAAVTHATESNGCGYSTSSAIIRLLNQHAERRSIAWVNDYLGRWAAIEVIEKTIEALKRA